MDTRIDSDEGDALSAYDFLAGYDGGPGGFWKRLAEYTKTRLESEAVCLLIGEAQAGGGVRVLAETAKGSAKKLVETGGVAGLPSIKGGLLHPLANQSDSTYEALAIPVAPGLPAIWMIAREPGKAAGEEASIALSREVCLLAERYQARRQAQRREARLVSLTEVLDIGLILGESDRFQEAALRLCNELAAPMHASRVSLAWTEGQDLKLKATSHGGRISKNSQECLALQQVMEEATDQDNEVSWPEVPGAVVISREHQQFSHARDDVAVMSIPLRHANGAVGALCLERASDEGVWESEEMERVRLLGDLVAPRLGDLHQCSGWFGRRWWRTSRGRAARLIGHENTGWKLTFILLGVLVAAMALIQIEHKVRAPFILKTDAAAIVSAPFPGYISEAHYHLGDVVDKDQLLVELDRKELLLEEADTEALLNKSLREARRNEADENLAAMRVSEAEAEQARARLAIVRHRLGLTQIVAPFSGVVVEGDLRERLSSPVEGGEELFKIVQLQDLFGQLQVDGRDISYLGDEGKGELAFTSRPGEKYAVVIDRFEPVAELRPDGTVFLLRVRILEESQDWWRPGMSGICKIDAGRRSILWIGFHRIIETVRLWLWV